MIRVFVVGRMNVKIKFRVVIADHRYEKNELSPIQYKGSEQKQYR